MNIYFYIYLYLYLSIYLYLYVCMYMYQWEGQSKWLFFLSISGNFKLGQLWESVLQIKCGVLDIFWR